MMTLRAWLAIAIIELIGLGVLTLLCSEPARLRLTAKLGLGFGLGLVALTITLFLASCCGLKPAWWLGAAEAIVIWAAAFLFRRTHVVSWIQRTPSDSPPSKGWLRWLEFGLILFIAGLCVVVSAVSLLEPLVEWDVIAIWAYKAKVLCYEPVRTTSYFFDLSKAYSHLDYPLLWPLAMTWVWSCVGQTDLETVKVLSPALLCAFAATFYGLLRQRREHVQSLLFTAMLLGLPMLTTQTVRLMTDVPLAYFVLAAFACVFLWLDSGHADDLRLAGFFAAGMLFTKNEGMGLLGIFIILSIGAALLRRQYRQCASLMVWLVLVPVALTLAWFVFRAGIPKVHEDYASRISPSFFMQNISRLPEVMTRSLSCFGDWIDWLGFWPLWVVVLIVNFKRWWMRWPTGFLLAAVVAVFLLYGYVCVVSPWSVADLIEATGTGNRLLLHIAPVCVFLWAECMRVEPVAVGVTPA